MIDPKDRMYMPDNELGQIEVIPEGATPEEIAEIEARNKAALIALPTYNEENDKNE